jgi:hypothetical protein
MSYVSFFLKKSSKKFGNLDKFPDLYSVIKDKNYEFTI